MSADAFACLLLLFDLYLSLGLSEVEVQNSESQVDGKEGANDGEDNKVNEHC